MPSRDYKEEEAMNLDSTVTPEWLLEEIRKPEKQVMVLDCRSHSEYHQGHIRDAINVTLPASVIMLRRLANGKLCISSVIKDLERREKFNRMWKTHQIVLYDDESDSVRPSGPCVMSTLFRRLLQEDCHVVCLQGDGLVSERGEFPAQEMSRELGICIEITECYGGFCAFKSRLPEWCDVGATADGEPLLTLENLRITPVSESEAEVDRCDSGLDRDASPNDPPFPVEIVPYLFLGNAENSSDMDALDRHKIRYILNVTPNLPNTFENEGLGIRYMQIPIQDHWSQNLASFFPEAIAFIEEARQKKQGILVHCLAGISRSVTITLAYLMQKLSMPLNDAYDFVRQRKANISPNFNFMGQLMDFERQLNLTPCPCTCQETPCHCQTLHFISPTRTTPDSGIDIDRWT